MFSMLAGIALYYYYYYYYYPYRRPSNRDARRRRDHVLYGHAYHGADDHISPSPLRQASGMWV
ncbi:uncharacterized protein MYCFIDRAFT_210824 [Pseudocercospora fijiensis CIRAD86]|uniref:Uncharacterized protein n=1 Tax=Pseudocercospora fijiensis (strain CIRAD86) TaxID=383855 RepID=M2ZZ88_PSEFD|nr:uncharacterized protein MYCFIDRAFT_210824 [Pseudocercospora fijiensis CIRAD86]EME84234.1 hypothetical protein MYCFIDRAFT_210824 [Pseudocercospora fijiensis CIRAD86]